MQGGLGEIEGVEEGLFTVFTRAEVEGEVAGIFDVRGDCGFEWGGCG